MELTNLLSVRSLSRKLLDDAAVPHLDAIILNAGIAGTTGIDFPAAIWQILTENAAAVTWPRYKLSAVGSVTGRQLPESSGVAEPLLGQVFCANVFGHYMLAHWLMGLLWKGRQGRVIWISSIEAGDEHFDESDLQGLRNSTAYECSKRVTDLLALTAGADASRESVRAFVAIPGRDGDEEGGSRPEILVVHPGIVATSIVPLPPVLMSLWVATAYVMRWIGSPWHTNTAYNGAASATWLALASSDEIRDKQKGSGMVKWGSAIDRSGHARVEMTDVKCWGVNGSAERVKETWWGGGWGRTIGATDATKGDVEGFVRQGARVWKEMEELRVDWEARMQKCEENASSHS